MVELKICLEAKGPLLLGTGLAIGNVQTSRPFVTGSAWRGAIANLVLAGIGRQHHSGRQERNDLADQADQAAFDLVFTGESAAQFRFLYPVRKTATQAVTQQAMPIPLTARSCKTYTGFAADDEHGVYDGLLQMLRRWITGRHPRLTSCPNCPNKKGRLERMRGFVVLDEAGAYAEAKMDTRSFVRVGLNRYSETAQDQILYVLDAHVPGPGDTDTPDPISFVGVWRGREEQETTLRRLLKGFSWPDDNGSYGLRIGGAKSFGMGQVRLRLESTQKLVTLVQRLDNFQPKVSDELIDHENDYAALTLRSPLQVLDSLGRPTCNVSVDILRAYGRKLPAGVEVIERCSVIEPETWAGWSSAWGLPKPVAPAIAAGSVLMLKSPRSQRDDLLAYLAALEDDGLGERGAEGWGEVTVCNPFHVEHDEARGLGNQALEGEDNHGN